MNTYLTKLNAQLSEHFPITQTPRREKWKSGNVELSYQTGHMVDAEFQSVGAFKKSSETGQVDFRWIWEMPNVPLDYYKKLESLKAEHHNTVEGDPESDSWHTIDETTLYKYVEQAAKLTNARGWTTYTTNKRPEETFLMLMLDYSVERGPIQFKKNSCENALLLVHADHQDGFDEALQSLSSKNAMKEVEYSIFNVGHYLAYDVLTPGDPAKAMDVIMRNLAESTEFPIYAYYVREEAGYELFFKIENGDIKRENCDIYARDTRATPYQWWHQGLGDIRVGWAWSDC